MTSGTCVRPARSSSIIAARGLRFALAPVSSPPFRVHPAWRERGCPVLRRRWEAVRSGDRAGRVQNSRPRHQRSPALGANGGSVIPFRIRLTLRECGRPVLRVAFLRSGGRTFFAPASSAPLPFPIVARRTPCRLSPGQSLTTRTTRRPENARLSGRGACRRSDGKTSRRFGRGSTAAAISDSCSSNTTVSPHHSGRHSRLR